MKRFWLVFTLFAAGTGVFAQEKEKKFTVQASPLITLGNIIFVGIADVKNIGHSMDIEVQYKINDLFNVSLSVSGLTDGRRIGKTSYFFNYFDNTVSVFQYFYEQNSFQINLKPMFIYRPFRTGLKGYYIGFYPRISWQSVEIKADEYLWTNFYIDGNENEIWTEIGLALNTGYKWIFKNGFTMQLSTSIGTTWNIPEKHDRYLVSNSDGRITLEHLDLIVLNFKMGYSF